MINIQWNNLKLPRGEAKKLYISLKESNNVYEDLQSFIQPEFKELHDKLLQLWEESKKEANSDEGKYFCDLHFALKLYELFEQDGFSLWEASDDEIWSGLTMKVAPDIYYDRWPWEEGDHEQRWIYKRTWRVWMKTLWWWIFLAMVADESGKLNKEKTLEQLSIHETTSIEILLDRCGSGFRVDFCRKLMKKHYDYCQKNNISGTERRSSLKFITMQCFLRASNIDPDLNGHDSFLDCIFEQMPGIRIDNESNTEDIGDKSDENEAVVNEVLEKYPFLEGEKGMVCIYKKILEKEGNLDKIPEEIKEKAFNFVNGVLGEGNELDRQTFELLFERGLEAFKKQIQKEIVY